MVVIAGLVGTRVCRNVAHLECTVADVLADSVPAGEVVFVRWPQRNIAAFCFLRSRPRRSRGAWRGAAGNEYSTDPYPR